MNPAGTRKIAWWRTSLGQVEAEAVARAMAEEHLSLGPVTREFEVGMARALGAPFAVATTSGSVALLLAMMAVGLKPGDEVLMPDRTFIATAHAAMLLGARPVLVEVREDLPLMDLADLEAKISPRSRAIVPVHLNGRAENLEAIGRLAEAHGLVVVEDAAQALFSRQRGGCLGTRSLAGCYSLGVTKLLTTGQGGLVVTGDAELAERLVRFRSHGMIDVLAEGTSRLLGFNFKFNDLLASVGLAQLERVAERLVRVRAVYERYAQGLAGLDFIRLIPVDLARGEVPLWVEARSPWREELIACLAGQGIEVRRLHPSLHLSPHLNGGQGFPRSLAFGREGLILPCGPDQPLENVERTIEALRSWPGAGGGR